MEVWEPVVAEHKSAEHLSFPLNKEDFRMESVSERNEGLVVRGLYS